MRNTIVMIWLVFAAFFMAPIVMNYATGEPYSEVISMIEREAESDQVEVVATKEKGNKALFAFTAGDDYGIAVFSHFADNYRYEEGIMSNGKDYIDVNLDIGWDIYEYRVTKTDIETIHIKAGQGIYKAYAMIAVLISAVTVMAIIYGIISRKRKKSKSKASDEKALMQEDEETKRGWKKI